VAKNKAAQQKADTSIKDELTAIPLRE